MSRIGNKPVDIPSGVEVKQDGNSVSVKGSKGEMQQSFDQNIKISIKDNQVIFERPNDQNKMKALHGTTRSNFNNMVEGVTNGFSKNLELVGVGYRVQLKGKKIILNVGYSNPVERDIPDYLKVEVPDNTHINISGINKQYVGDFAADIRSIRSPEPYKGKGIRYEGEYVRRKEGKTGK